MDEFLGSFVRWYVLAIAAIVVSWGALVTLAVLSVTLPNDALPPILLAGWLLAILASVAIGTWKRSWVFLPLVPAAQLFLLIRSPFVRRR